MTVDQTQRDAYALALTQQGISRVDAERAAEILQEPQRGKDEQAFISTICLNIADFGSSTAESV